MFFTSDSHLGHKRVLNYSNRPFESVEAMDEELITQINNHVKEDDVLWHLGDFAMYSYKDTPKSYYERCEKYRERIKCQNINIVWGNHDDPIIADLFNESHNLKEIQLSKRKFLILCHYAMAIWRKSHRGAIHLYGHSHGTAETWLDEKMPGRKSMDVGVDNAAKLLGCYRPWSFKVILDRLEGPTSFSFDHHVPIE